MTLFNHRRSYERIADIEVSQRSNMSKNDTLSLQKTHFNRLGKAAYSLFTDDNYVMYPDISRLYTGISFHFAANPGDGSTKAENMEHYVRCFLAWFGIGTAIIRCEYC